MREASSVRFKELNFSSNLFLESFASEASRSPILHSLVHSVYSVALKSLTVMSEVSDLSDDARLVVNYNQERKLKLVPWFSQKSENNIVSILVRQAL
jgi:hypothetical protein